MSRTVTCPECGEGVDARGLSGHLTMGHGITGSDQQQITEELLGEEPEAPAEPEEPEAPEAPIVQQDDGTAADGGRPVCENCGSSDSVQTKTEMQQAARSNGAKLSPEVAKHSHFCGRCSIAFDGDQR